MLVNQAWLRLNLNRPGLQINWEASFHRLSDYIVGVVRPDYGQLNLYAQGVKQFTNLPSANVVSTHLQVMWDLNDHWQLVNVSKYNYGAITAEEPMPLVPPLRNIFSLNYTNTRWFLQLENESAAAQNRVNQSMGETPTDAFTLFNARLAYSLNSEKINWQVNLSGENLLNTIYTEHLDWAKIHRPGRNLSIGLTVRY